MHTTTEVRTVQVEIEVEESEPLTYQYNEAKRFQPLAGTVRVGADGTVVYVQVTGPVLTSGGRLHSTSVREWTWQAPQQHLLADDAWPPLDVPPVALRLVRHAVYDGTGLDVHEVAATHEVLVEATGLRLTDAAIDQVATRDYLVAAVHSAGPGHPHVRCRLMDELARELIGEPWPDPRGKTGLRMILAEATRRGWLLPEE